MPKGKKTMKGVRWHGPKDLRVEELPFPPPPEKGWARIKLMACGICGTDLHDYEHGILSLSKTPGARHKLPPLVLGHEFCGVIARKQGRIVIVGGSGEPTPINFRDFLRSEKEMIGSFGRFDEWEEAIILLSQEPHVWQRVITKLPLKETPAAFQMLRTPPAAGQGAYVKVVILTD